MILTLTAWAVIAATLAASLWRTSWSLAAITLVLVAILVVPLTENPDRYVLDVLAQSYHDWIVAVVLVLCDAALITCVSAAPEQGE